jgi:hypothetical protein
VVPALGSAPLPPVAELEAEHGRLLSEWWLAPEYSIAELNAGTKLKQCRERLETARRATGGNGAHERDDKAKRRSDAS